MKPGLSGGFHLASNTSTGKTTALIAAGSVWGGGGQLGFVQSWNATANGIEATAQLHNNVLLALDELKELPADHAGRIAYQLANGQGRATMDRNRARRHRQTWSLIFLSSGEFGFTTHILASEKRVYAGQEVRVCEISANRGPFGAFDCIHSAANAGVFAQILAQGAMRNFGSAAPAFIAEYLKMERVEAQRELDRLMADFSDGIRAQGCAPEVMRVLQRFALVAAAGEFATRFGVTGWQMGDAARAVSDIFSNWIQQRGTSGSCDQKQALQHAKEYLLQFGPSRFQRHRSGKILQSEGRILNRIGFLKEGDGGLEYQFLDHLPREFCGPFSERTILEALDSAQALIKESGRLNTKRVLPDFGGNKKVRCYVISHERLFADADEQ